MKKLSSLEEGAGLIEYALILILVGIIIFVLITLLGPAISKFISDLMASV
jgi:pilus assembly protein Flp/PilA